MIEAIRKTWVRFALVGAAAYLVFLVANLPAAWFGYALERSSGGALGLGDPRGTVWKGQGTLAVRSGGSFRRIADIQWRCNPLSVFAGRLGVALSGEAPGASLRGNVSLGLRSLLVQNVEVSAPVAILEPAVPMAAFVKPEGRVRILSDSLEIGRENVRGAATVEWSEAGMSGVARVGDYRLQITGTGERATLKLVTLRGDLRVNGDGEWAAKQPGVLQLRGQAQTLGERKDLEPLLTLLAGPGSANPRPFGWMLTI
ncbi:MAG TPA: type II secretion system protein N [Burkholderiales bacterium]|nr:type II secretion system protein N [Burkholderiales bacterium]